MLDHIHLIGMRHFEKGQPCQDYCEQLILDDYEFLFVSDGCSSGGRTELGAKLLVIWAKNILRENPIIFSYPAEFQALLLAKIRENSLQLSFSDYLATLQILGYNKVLDCFTIFSMGDGLFGYQKKSEDFTIIESNYSNNTPFYLAYLVHPRYSEPWFNQHPVLYTCEHTPYGSTHSELDLSVHRDATYSYQVIPATDINLFFIASDGLTSFNAKALTQTYLNLFTFKSKSGAFLQRRVLAENRKWIKDLESGPQDDLAIGCFLKEA